MSRLLFWSFDGAGTTSAPNAYSRMMTALLPPGKLWRLIGDSLLGNLLAGCADELGRLEARMGDLITESVPTGAEELLPEYEDELALDPLGTITERQARVVSRTVARQRYRPIDFQAALAPLFGFTDPTDVLVIERSHADAVALGDDREVFRFFLYRRPFLPGTYYLASSQDLVDQIKPSHTIGTVIESVSFACDDPYSLCDRDLLGA